MTSPAVWREHVAQASDDIITLDDLYSATELSTIGRPSNVSSRIAPDGSRMEKPGELSSDHYQFLLERHGTANLDPVPDPCVDDPLNWPKWKKLVNLAMVAVHACMGTFMAAAIIPAYEEIAQEFGISIVQASSLTAAQIACLGVAPFVWRPLADAYGRKLAFSVSLLFSFVFNAGCAGSGSFAAMMVMRVLAACFIAPAGAIGSAVVQEMFFKAERAKYMGVWTLMVTLGVPLSPFIFGFVAERVSYRWVYWILAIINGVQLVLYLAFGRETRYVRGHMQAADEKPESSLWAPQRIDKSTKLRNEFIQPFRCAGRVHVLLPAIAYAAVFQFGSVLTTVEIPQLFAAKFHFGPQQLGLQFIALIIGSLIGEQVGGRLSDIWMKLGARRRDGQRPDPEYRLWLSYIGYLLAMIGVVVFLVLADRLTTYDVSATIGAGVAAAGNQVVTTVLVTYAVDCYPNDASAVGVFVTFVRQMLGFAAPYWLPAAFETASVAGTAGICVAVIVAASVMSTVWLQLHPWRARTSVKEDV